MGAISSAIPIDSDGRFSGYASLFNRRDAGGDVVMPGAFTQSLARRGKRIRLLFQHDPKEPVGTWKTIGEDGHGLFVTGRLVPGVPRADALRRLIENGALDGLSIGFRTVRASRAGGLRKLWQIDLFEISIVTFPMLEDARIAPSGLSTGAAIAAATHTIRNR
ncbi:HK97 family phage prohead protease [Devosia sp. BSSL-BM10]|uniref:HK97 family phage prohead protease n=1 Tax=Devosia litorisediminis TaxID=2829817 RepID=A0A942EFX1_9HYPH|nr:HK97 family phage prohead protease [Devosia litorisediminis]MBS3849121.1 HK97 family phage prohead protease [Devosia litorisediminis]